MKASRIESRDNPLIKTIRRVAGASRQAPEELVIAEGMRVLEEVERAGCEIKAAVISENFGLSPRERKLLQAWSSRAIRACRVPESLFEYISGVQTPQGSLALVRIPILSLSNVRPSQGCLILFACGIQDPGNLGTLIRTATAAGASLVCTAPGTVSARNPKVIRASAGTFFHLPVIENIGLSDFREYCEHNAIRLYRTDTREGTVYAKAELQSSCAILLGNEGGGLSEKEFAGIPAIRIPMAKGVESLNVAMAGSIILFEAARQRMKV